MLTCARLRKINLKKNSQRMFAKKCSKKLDEGKLRHNLVVLDVTQAFIPKITIIKSTSLLKGRLEIEF